jgi:PilZ domain
VHCLYKPERRSVRYYLRLPVSVKLANKEMYARSENISLSGILLSSAFRIPEGSTVELAVGAGPTADPSVLTARGKVLRVQPKASGDFAIAIECDRAFEPMRGDPNSLPTGGV